MNRRTVMCVVEGQTEKGVLDRLVGPYLGTRGIDLHTTLVRIGRHRGGMAGLTADQLYQQLRNHLRDRRAPVVTTFLDYYGLPTTAAKGWDFVGHHKSYGGGSDPGERARRIEDEIRRRTLHPTEDLRLATRLVPYIQLHELEALYFAEPEKVATILGRPEQASKLRDCVTKSKGCEFIDDHPHTAPSKRITESFPAYHKGSSELAHGPRIAAALDLSAVRQACPRFDAWLAKLERA